MRIPFAAFLLAVAPASAADLVWCDLPEILHVESVGEVWSKRPLEVDCGGVKGILARNDSLAITGLRVGAGIEGELDDCRKVDFKTTVKGSSGRPGYSGSYFLSKHAAVPEESKRRAESLGDNFGLNYEERGAFGQKALEELAKPKAGKCRLDKTPGTYLFLRGFGAESVILNDPACAYDGYGCDKLTILGSGPAHWVAPLSGKVAPFDEARQEGWRLYVRTGKAWASLKQENYGRYKAQVENAISDGVANLSLLPQADGDKHFEGYLGGRQMFIVVRGADLAQIARLDKK